MGGGGELLPIYAGRGGYLERESNLPLAPAPSNLPPMEEEEEELIFPLP